MFSLLQNRLFSPLVFTTQDQGEQLFVSFYSIGSLCSHFTYWKSRYCMSILRILFFIKNSRLRELLFLVLTMIFAIFTQLVHFVKIILISYSVLQRACKYSQLDIIIKFYEWTLHSVIQVVNTNLMNMSCGTVSKALLMSRYNITSESLLSARSVFLSKKEIRVV